VPATSSALTTHRRAGACAARHDIAPIHTFVRTHIHTDKKNVHACMHDQHIHVLIIIHTRTHTHTHTHTHRERERERASEDQQHVPVRHVRAVLPRTHLCVLLYSMLFLQSMCVLICYRHSCVECICVCARAPCVLLCLLERL
jgi:hypothetical protein